MKQVSDNDTSDVYRAAVEQGLIETEDTLVVFYDVGVLKDRVASLRKSFPADTLHAIAVKSNPLSFVLQQLVELGFGLEAASFGEVYLARCAGAADDAIVFDSPAKTADEIAQLQSGSGHVLVNANTIEELELYDKESSGLRLGLRVNPEVPASSVDYLNVSGAGSKFGEPISNREAIVEACSEWRDLNCLHMHAGSQYADLQRTVSQVRAVVDLANEINQSSANKISVLDIGGGFPVSYEQDNEYHIKAFADALRDSCPELFDGSYQLVTEFGRYVHANASWMVSNVEYVKQTAEVSTAIIHAGADMFLRECYNPGDWFHHMVVLDAEGNIKDAASKTVTHVAGPLCFGGDYIDRNRKLPQVQAGDKLVIKDVGANTYSLWSRHCSRQFPKVIAYDSSLDRLYLRIVKRRETLEQMRGFWT